MDWELVINTISDIIKDDSLREEIYRKMLEETQDFDRSEDCLGEDDVFDRIWEELYDEYEEEENTYDDNDDFGYDDD
jgi:hypothetical protein